MHHEKNLIDGWEDIPDIMIPHVFIKWVIISMNRLHDGTQYSDRAFSNLMNFLLNIYPFITRDITSKEKERLESLMEIPSHFGGMGY